MRDHLPHTREAFLRVASPSSVLILAMAIAYFGPALWDRHMRPTPWVSATVDFVYPNDGSVYITSFTHAKYSASGRRMIWIENRKGQVLCAGDRYDTWKGDRRRDYTFDAFFDGHCDYVPKEDWRACWQFSLVTPFGSRADFGPECSEFQIPLMDPADVY